MRLYEKFADTGFHTCIATTFGIDFDAYENIVLPRLRGASCFNNVLLADSRMLSYALDGASVLPEHAGRHYTVAGIQADSVFHPKMTLQLGRRGGQVIIASANMTASGLAGNLELVGLIECTAEQSGETQLIAAAWAYLSGTFENGNQALAHQLQWLRARTPWLFEAAPATGPVTLADGSVAALLFNGASASPAGIGLRFAALIEEQPVERLIVVSPYWDEDLAALKALASNLAAQKVLILIDAETALFPAKAVKAVPNAEIFDLNKFSRTRFVHAKAIIAETDHADHLLFGSANCTVAALGTENYAGANHEACLYRRLPPRTILEKLGLNKVINEQTSLRPDELPAYREGEDLPLAEAGVRSPGQFESAFDTLFWWPPTTGVTESEIELLSSAGTPMPVGLAAQGGEASPRRFQISGAIERPAFARLRYTDGTRSAPAIVSAVDALRETVREARSRKVESVALQLSEETEEGLWLWEVLNELEAAELAQSQEESPGTKRKRTRADENGTEEQYRKLSYEDFIAGRRLRSDNQGTERNSLAGSELSLVRNFLNRILTIGNETAGPLPDEEAIGKSFDLGDETADAASALEAGEEFTKTTAPSGDADSEEEIKRRRAARAKASREQIVQAVAKFNARLKEKAETGQISSFDVLRLRAMLMIIAAAGQSNMPSSKQTSLQVLPLNNNSEGWPKLMGQLLFSFFGGNRPAIRHLEIETIHDQIPNDILECWATALWAIHACGCAAGSHKDMQGSTLPMIARLAEQICARTGLQAGELKGEIVTEVLDRLNERFAKRLGFNPEELNERHRQAISTVHAAR